MFSDIKWFYVLKSFNIEKEYVETDSLEDFEIQINTILKLNDINFQLSNEKIVNLFDVQLIKHSLGTVVEARLKELLQETSKYYDANNKQIAEEKI